jgi:hypothetical protein
MLLIGLGIVTEQAEVVREGVRLARISTTGHRSQFRSEWLSESGQREPSRQTLMRQRSMSDHRLALRGVVKESIMHRWVRAQLCITASEA